MKYKFIGRPDKTFPELITGQIYTLKIITREHIFRVDTYPIITIPIQCPYSSWETFYKNWKPIGGKND